MRKFLSIVLLILLSAALTSCACNHEWIEATCMEPKHCSICDVTEGDKLSHVSGDWEVDESSRDIVNGTIQVRRYCIRCKSAIESKPKTIKLHDDKKFILTPSHFEYRLEYVMDKLDEGVYEADLREFDNGDIVLYLFKYDSSIAMIQFFDNSMNQISSENSTDISYLFIDYFETNTSEVVESMVGMIMMCDPYLDIDEAQIVGSDMIYFSVMNKAYPYNELEYAYGNINGKYRMIISASKIY